MKAVKQPPLSVPSFAKINWNLQILGRRSDGYHEVNTLLQTISLHDDLEFELTDNEISLHCSEPDIPTDDRNLIVRAAQLLQRRYNVDRGVRVRLEKRIPAQGGLGGASSNAAVALVALAYLWKLNTNASELLEIAASIGSDVPFFLHGGCALATGTGATVSPVSDAPNNEQKHLILVTPNAGVSTADAYASLNCAALTTPATNPILSSSRSESNLGNSLLCDTRDSLRNDFESVIFDIEPEIRRCKEALLQAGAMGALLAGSGSSVFGIFADLKEQQRALDDIKLEAGWHVFPCVTVSRNEYRRALGNWAIPFLRSFNSETDLGA